MKKARIDIRTTDFVKKKLEKKSEGFASLTEYMLFAAMHYKQEEGKKDILTTTLGTLGVMRKMGGLSDVQYDDAVSGVIKKYSNVSNA